MGHPKDQPLRFRRELLTPAADGSYPDPARTHAGAHGPHAQRVERHLLPRHGFPRRREGAECLRRSRRARPRCRHAAAGERLAARDRGAGPAAGQRRSRRTRGHLESRRGVRFREGLPRPAQGRRDRRRHRAAGHRRLRAKASAICSREMLGPGRGLELVSTVNDIPKGSRLAVSTNLLAALIGVCMRATGQAESLTGPLRENERRLVLARALLGEWIGGSRRRLAGFRRRLAGHQADRRRRRADRRSRARHLPRTADAAASRFHARRNLRRKPASACRIRSSSSTAAWRKTSGRSSRW